MNTKKKFVDQTNQNFRGTPFGTPSLFCFSFLAPKKREREEEEEEGEEKRNVQKKGKEGRRRRVDLGAIG